MYTPYPIAVRHNDNLGTIKVKEKKQGTEFILSKNIEKHQLTLICIIVSPRTLKLDIIIICSGQQLSIFEKLVNKCCSTAHQTNKAFHIQTVKISNIDASNAPLLNFSARSWTDMIMNITISKEEVLLSLSSRTKPSCRSGQNFKLLLGVAHSICWPLTRFFSNDIFF